MNLSQEVTFEALDPQSIRERMLPPSLQLLERLTVLNETDSSNSALLRLPVEQQHAHAILAESQTRGRGRRQRDWYSPPGCTVYLSLGWNFGSKGTVKTARHDAGETEPEGGTWAAERPVHSSRGPGRICALSGSMTWGAAQPS